MTLGLIVFEVIGSGGVVVGLVGLVFSGLAANGLLRGLLFHQVMSRSRHISPEEQAEFEQKSAASTRKLLRWGLPMTLGGAVVFGLAYGADVLLR